MVFITKMEMDILMEEARRFQLDILGLSQTHLTDAETLINNCQAERVGIIISPKILYCLLGFKAVSSRMITATLYSR